MAFEIIKGRKKMPFNVILFGVPGIGKSSWAAGHMSETGEWIDGAPKPIFLGNEENDELTVDRFPIPLSYDDLIKQLNQLIADPMGYETVVIDTLDSIEKLLHKKILAADPKQTGSMMAAFGGYGKAYDRAETELMHMRGLLKALRDKHGLNIILLAHSKKVKAVDTLLGLEYDTFELNLHAKAQAVFIDWVSAVLFANYVAHAKDGVNSDKVFAMGHGDRVLLTAKRPGHLGKNRYALPYELPLCFADFYECFEAFYKQPAGSASALYLQIVERLSLISDQHLFQTIEKTLEAARGDDVKLRAILIRVNELIQKTEAAASQIEE